MNTLAYPADLGRSIAAAAALAASLNSPAHALLPGESITLSGGSLPGSFSHAYSLSPASARGIDYFPSGESFLAPLPTTGSAASPFPATTAIIPGGDGAQGGVLLPNSFILGLLGTGTYRLDINGTAAGMSLQDGYSGMSRAVPAIAPMPEPEIWAMMLVGLGLVIIRLRQKRRLDDARHFS